VSHTHIFEIIGFRVLVAQYSLAPKSASRYPLIADGLFVNISHGLIVHGRCALPHPTFQALYPYAGGLGRIYGVRLGTARGDVGVCVAVKVESDAEEQILRCRIFDEAIEADVIESVAEAPLVEHDNRKLRKLSVYLLIAFVVLALLGLIVGLVVSGYSYIL